MIYHILSLLIFLSDKDSQLIKKKKMPHFLLTISKANISDILLSFPTFVED